MSIKVKHDLLEIVLNVQTPAASPLVDVIIALFRMIVPFIDRRERANLKYF